MKEDKKLTKVRKRLWQTHYSQIDCLAASKDFTKYAIEHVNNNMGACMLPMSFKTNSGIIMALIHNLNRDGPEN
jgi:hypothetical protein